MTNIDKNKILLFLVINLFAILAFFQHPYGRLKNPFIWLIPQFILFIFLNIPLIISIAKKGKIISKKFMIIYSILFLTIIYIIFLIIGTRYFGFLEGAELDFGFYGTLNVLIFFIIILAINWILLSIKIPKILFYIAIIILLIAASYSFYDRLSRYTESQNFKQDEKKVPWMDETKLKNLNVHEVNECNREFLSKAFKGWCYIKIAREKKSYEICNMIPETIFNQKETCMKIVKNTINYAYWECDDIEDESQRIACYIDSSLSDYLVWQKCPTFSNEFIKECFLKVSIERPSVGLDVCNNMEPAVKEICISVYEKSK